MSEDFLKGKFVRSNRDTSLAGYIVDGKIPSNSDFLIPRIRFGKVYRIKECIDDVVKLQNISDDSWQVCEVPLSFIEDFKLVKNI